MPLVPPVNEHCDLPMKITEAKIFCKACNNPEIEQKLTLPINKQNRIENWPMHCLEDTEREGGFLSLEWHLKCQNCSHTISEIFPNGRISPDLIPGKFTNRVFIGGNYDHLANLRDVKKSVFKINHEVKSNFVPILPYDDFLLPAEEIHDWDLRLLHLCSYAIFEVTYPAGELMEIQRVRDYKVNTLLVYDGSRSKGEPAKARTMLLQSGEHEHQGYWGDDHLTELIRGFLLTKDHLSFKIAWKNYGYSYKSITVRNKLYPDGFAEHEYSYSELGVHSTEHKINQLNHFFTFSLGTIIEDQFEFGYSPSGIDISWKDDNALCTSRAKVGVVNIEGGLIKSSPKVHYWFRLKTKDAFVMTKDQREHVPIEKMGVSYEAPHLPPTVEYLTRLVPAPSEIFELSFEFFKGYPVEPRPVADFGGEPRLEDALRQPPDKFEFDTDKNIAKLIVHRPKVGYLYGICWEVPETIKGT